MLELCSVHTIPEGETRGFNIQGQPLFVVRKDLQCYVYRNACPHQGVQLNWMEHQFLDQENHFIQCSTHGALFEPETGLCVQGPCQGASLEPIESEQQNGKLYVYM
ncbi:MAG: Rieske (2Fe-2S) protein [Pseudomonadales bacterium]